MTDPTPPEPDVDPSAAELAALRKEKADRDQADRDAKDKELEELRAYRAAEDDRKAKAVKPPTPKADKPAPTPEPVAAPAKRSHVSRSWFGDVGE